MTCPKCGGLAGGAGEELRCVNCGWAGGPTNVARPASRVEREETTEKEPNMGGMSAEGRQRIAEAMRRSWARRRAGSGKREAGSGKREAGSGKRGKKKMDPRPTLSRGQALRGDDRKGRGDDKKGRGDDGRNWRAKALDALDAELARRREEMAEIERVRATIERMT